LPARTEGVQPADGSLRTRRYRFGPVLRLARQERLPLAIRRVARGSVPADLQGISAEPALRELQHRPDGRRADEEPRQDGHEVKPVERSPASTPQSDIKWA